MWEGDDVDTDVESEVGGVADRRDVGVEDVRFDRRVGVAYSLGAVVMWEDCRPLGAEPPRVGRVATPMTDPADPPPAP